MDYYLNVNGNEKSYSADTTYEEIAREYQSNYANTILLAELNGKTRELFKNIEGNGNLTFLTAQSREGYRTYRRTMSFLMLKAAYDINEAFGINKMAIEFTIGNGLYCNCNKPINEEYVHTLKDRMEELIKKDLLITKKLIDTKEGIALFKERGMEDKARLFAYRRSSRIHIYELDGYIDYCYGYMLPSTGYLTLFDLQFYEGGVILVMPEISEPDKLCTFTPYRGLFNVLKESNNWGRLMNVSNAADLNDCIANGNIKQLVLVQEALQEKKIAEIAEDIYKKNKKIVLIAGPSSSGKTTFSHRLSVQLETLGIIPHPIPVDNYFINREYVKNGPDGKPDFESLDLVDLVQFNKDMNRLLAGEKVEIPFYNFITGKREYKGNYEQLGSNDVLVVEGIHCLNEEMSYDLPKRDKYKIYISALTVLNVDDHNRIPTADARMLRRMVRDARTRNNKAIDTISGWESVRRGENKNIFPFQEEADVMFNSVLIYEIAAIKPYAEALLFGVEDNTPEYAEARKLLKFLNYFVTMEEKDIPKNSLLREFIGGGCFNI